MYKTNWLNYVVAEKCQLACANSDSLANLPVNLSLLVTWNRNDAYWINSAQLPY